jgi:peptidoglycan/LPS O-acetylase OafA/YrhL
MTAHYIGFFLLGIILASTISATGRWWHNNPMPIRWAIGVGALLLFTFDRFCAIAFLAITQQIGVLQQPDLVTVVSDWFTAVAAIGLILIGLHARHAGLILMSLPAKFLGKISYSVYLVHPIVLLALTFSLRDRVSMWFQLPIFLCLTITLGWLFNRTIEEPCIRLSRMLSG